MARFETVVLDMAGTTVADDGLVLAAFERAWRETAPANVTWEQARAHVVATMGQSKITVFRGLVDEDTAQQLNTAFERAVTDLVTAGHVRALPGAAETIARLRADGRSVVLTTGFSRATADAIVHTLGWQDRVDAVITPADAGRGRPAPDMVLLAALRTGASAMSAVAVAGDTASDAGSGRNAGAGLIAAVRTGGVPEPELRAAGAQTVLDSIADLPALLDERERA